MTTPADSGQQPPDTDPLVSWRHVGHQLGKTALGGLVGAVAAGLIAKLSGTPAPTALGVALGVGALVAVGGAIWLVAGSAWRGMLRAGERGERLAGDDVGLTPPKLRRHGRERWREADSR